MEKERPGKTISHMDPEIAAGTKSVRPDELYQAAKDTFDYLGTSASATEQTGLIPAALKNRAEEKSYQQLYPYAPPVPTKDTDSKA